MISKKILIVLIIGVFSISLASYVVYYSNNVIALQTTVIPTDVIRKPYAQISDQTTQPCLANGAASNVTLSTNDEIFRMTHSTTTRTNEIIIQEKGIYQIIAAPQVGQAAGQANGIENLWLVKNNVDVPNTNIKTTVMLQAGAAETMTGVINWIGFLNKDDIVSFKQSCDDQDIGLIFTPAAIPPNTPSIIITVVKISW